jgi:hypothetical protein
MTMGRVGLAALLAVLMAAGAATASEGAAVEPGWARAAQRLEMPVYRPDRTEGLTLRSVTTGRPCQNQQVTAVYRGPQEALLRVYEGKPFFCGDLGDVRGLGTAYVGRRLAHFYESPNSDNQPGLFLTWCTRKRAAGGRCPGVEMSVEIDGRDKPRALRVARSMRLVPN